MNRHSHALDMLRTERSGLPTSPSWQRALREPSTWALALCALLLASFFAVPYLPMVDMPQHSAQISIWLHLHDAQLPEMQLFELNLRTPYLGAYVLARALAGFIGVVPALKVAVWLAIVGHWAAFDWLVRSLGYPRWLGLLGVPLGMGYAFYFGFISFLGALPFGLCAVCLALRHRNGPSVRSGLLLGAALCATLATHGFALGLTVVLCAPLLLRGNGSMIARGAPFLAPALLIVVWLMPGSSARAIGLTVWDPRFWELFRELPALLLAASSTDRAASTFGLIVLGFIALSLGRPSRAPERYLPLAVMLLGFCLFPLSFGGFTPLHPRFATFLVPALLLAFEPRAEPRFAWLPLGIAVTTGAWFGLFAFRLSQFARETQPVHDFVARMPSRLRIRPIVFERTSQAFPGLPALLHLSAYYVPEKAGIQGYSFAMYPTSVIRYVPAVVPTMDQGSEWHPEWFSASQELPAYDCFLVTSFTDRSLELFGEQSADLNLAFQEGRFWAYLKRSAATASNAHTQETRQREQPMDISGSR